MSSFLLLRRGRKLFLVLFCATVLPSFCYISLCLFHCNCDTEQNSEQFRSWKLRANQPRVEGEEEDVDFYNPDGNIFTTFLEDL